jgi:hypothetical protein
MRIAGKTREIKSSRIVDKPDIDVKPPTDRLHPKTRNTRPGREILPQTSNIIADSPGKS